METKENKTSHRKRGSLFARALEGLLRAPKDMTYADWAGVLGVSPPAISQWLADETLPRPDRLYAIIRRLREIEGLPREPLQQFADMATRPGRRVSPHGHRLHPNVAYYMLEPLRESLITALATVPSRVQEEMLLRSIRQCHQLTSSETEAGDLFSRSVSLPETGEVPVEERPSNHEASVAQATNTPLSEAERAAALSGGKLTTIHLERDGRQQVDLMVTHHYLTGARNLEDEHDVLNLLKARALQIGQSGATVTRVKLEHEPLDVRSDRSELSESLSRVYTEIHVKCIVTPERLGMVVRNGAAAGWHPSKNPFATRADGQFVQFVNRRFYTTPGTPLDMSLIDAEVAKLVLLIEHVASIDEIKYESAIYDSNDALDRWWMQS